MLTWLIIGTLVPSAIIALLAAGLVRRFGPSWGWVDRPGERKVHSEPMPTCGGLAIWLGIVAPLATGQLALALHRGGYLQIIFPGSVIVPAAIAPYLDGLWYQSGKLWLLVAGGTLLLALGMADDRRGLDWRLRLFVQTSVATALVLCGWQVRLPWDWPVLAAIASIIWIVALVNSFNMLDNMDGLSASVAAICGMMLAAAALLAPRPDNHQPQLFVAGFLLVLVGSLFGFLWHNRPPARLFMGDAGSYLIGYWLAMATLTATFAGGDLPRHGVLAPLCVLAVPLYDMASVIVIRLRSGRSPFVGDKNHFSHRLVALGMSKSQALATICLVTATCGLGALVLHEVDRIGAAIVVLTTLCMLLIVAILEAAGGNGRKGLG